MASTIDARTSFEQGASGRLLGLRAELILHFLQSLLDLFGLLSILRFRQIALFRAR